MILAVYDLHAPNIFYLCQETVGTTIQMNKNKFLVTVTNCSKQRTLTYFVRGNMTVHLV